MGTATDTVSYTYDSTWGDLLTKYDGQSITYDAIGNPTSYYNGTRWAFAWENGRQLASASNGTESIAYTYDADGLRTGMTVTSPLDLTQKNGLFVDSDGETRYYVDGVATYAGLVYWDGYFYYINSSLKAVRNRTYWVTYPNGLMEEGNYTFDAYGRMVDPPADAATASISTFAASGETMSKTYEYIYAGGKLMRQVLTVTNGNSTTTYALDFFYVANGTPFAVKYNGDMCYYITNLQGDVISIVDSGGEVIASYEYDPYGNIVSATGYMAKINPLRYRGYVYDSETEMYYLQSRYYDPELGRFINADVLLSTGQGILGNNMFAYCNNNSVNACDPRGTFTCQQCFGNCNEDGSSCSTEHYPYTTSVGISGSITVGPFVYGMQLALVTDTLGYTELQFTYYSPLSSSAIIGTPAADEMLDKAIQYEKITDTFEFSLMGNISFYDAPLCENLHGEGYQIGGAVGNGYAAGVDYIILPNGTSDPYNGISFSGGWGSTDFHGVMVSTSKVIQIPISVYDLFNIINYALTEVH